MSSDSEPEKNRIKKLQGSRNFRSWKQELEIEFDYKDCLEVVKGELTEPEAPIRPAPVPNATPAQTTEYNAELSVSTASLQVYIKAKADYKKKKAAAARILWKTISDEIKGEIEEWRMRPKELWDKLESLYDKQTLCSVSNVRDEMTDIRYTLDQDADKFYAKITSCQNKLKDLKAPVPTYEMINIYIKSISQSGSPDLDQYRTALLGKYRIDSNPTDVLDDIKNFIGQLKHKVKEDEKIHTHYTHFNKNGQKSEKKDHSGSKDNSKRPKAKVRYCNHCKTIGHTDEGCFHLHPELKAGYEERRAKRTAEALKEMSTTTSKTETVTSKSIGLDTIPNKKTRVLMTRVVAIDDEKEEVQEEVKSLIVKPNNNYYPSMLEWNLDSCAGMHVCCNKQYFISMYHPPKRWAVVGGSGHECVCRGIGTVKITIETEDSSEDVHVTECLYVPTFNANLISVGQLASKGLGTCFDPVTQDKSTEGIKGYVYDGLTQEVVMRCTLRNKIYVIDQVFTPEFRIIAQLANLSITDEFFEAGSGIAPKPIGKGNIQYDETFKIYNTHEVIESEEDEILNCEEETSTGQESCSEEEEIPTSKQAKPGAVEDDPTWNLWHCRFGHPHKTVMRSLGYTHNIPALQKKINGHRGICHGCLAGKAAQRTRTRKSNNHPLHKSKKPYDMIHADTAGPFTPRAIDGNAKYFQVYIDDHSGYSTIVFPISIAETPENIKTVQKFVENATGNTLKTFKSDNGTEFVNKVNAAWFKSKGVVHETSAPYTPQQNGKAERRVKEIKTRMKILMAVAGAPNSFWKLAAEYANYIVNRLNTRTNPASKSPYEILNGYPPQISRLRVWGCSAYANVPIEKRGQFTKQVVKAAFMGIEGDNGPYKLYDPVKRKFFISDDVLFDEHDFSVFSKTSRQAIGVQGNQPKTLTENQANQ